MNKNSVFCFLFILISIMSYNSYASIVTYNLKGDYWDLGSVMPSGELNGFIAFESEGKLDTIDLFVDFTVHDFFLATPNEVLIQCDNAYDNSLRFYADTDGSYWNNGPNLWVKSVSDPVSIPLNVYLLPENGSLIFAPDTFDIFNSWRDIDYRFYQLHAESSYTAPTYKAPAYEALTYAAPAYEAPAYAVSAVDEPGTFTFVLYGLLSVFLIGVIKRTNVIKI